MKIYVATANQNKITEISAILAPLGVEILVHPNYETLNVEETGNTFEENAAIKAVALSRLTDEYVIADDSGLSVEVLYGEPGVHSSRYSGKGDEENNKLLLHNMQNAENRSGAFISVIVLAKNGKAEAFFRGECFGTIGYEPKGENGFGYDPIFIPQGYTVSIAEISPEEKNNISHRRNALNKLADYFRKA